MTPCHFGYFGANRRTSPLPRCVIYQSCHYLLLGRKAESSFGVWLSLEVDFVLFNLRHVGWLHRMEACWCGVNISRKERISNGERGINYYLFFCFVYFPLVFCPSDPLSVVASAPPPPRLWLSDPIILTWLIIRPSLPSSPPPPCILHFLWYRFFLLYSTRSKVYCSCIPLVKTLWLPCESISLSVQGICNAWGCVVHVVCAALSDWKVAGSIPNNQRLSHRRPM